jgi:hypothetical protein
MRTADAVAFQRECTEHTGTFTVRGASWPSEGLRPEPATVEQAPVPDAAAPLRIPTFRVRPHGHPLPAQTALRPTLVSFLL